MGKAGKAKVGGGSIIDRDGKVDSTLRPLNPAGTYLDRLALPTHFLLPPHFLTLSISFSVFETPGARVRSSSVQRQRPRKCLQLDQAD